MNTAHKIYRMLLLAMVLGSLTNCTVAHSDSYESTESLCGQAVEHFAICTDASVSTIDMECDASEAAQILDTPCEVLQRTFTGGSDIKADAQASSVTPITCRWFNVGCPPDDSCLPELSSASYADLVALSDPDTLVDKYDARHRVNSVAAIFRNEGDPRGLFATVYRLITNRAVESVENGDYGDAMWANDLIIEFARRYLRNLHGHLTGAKVTGQWAKYYDLAQNCRVGRGRTVGVAIAVHLMVDLPYTLHSIDSGPDRRDDFVLFGDILLEVFPQLVTDLKADYDTDVEDLFKGFFVGDWVDGFTKEGTMTSFMYQGIRLKAWQDSQNLRFMPKWLVAADIKARWGLAEHTLAKLDAVGML